MNYLREAAIFPPSTVKTAPVVFLETAKWKKALATSSAFTSFNNKLPFFIKDLKTVKDAINAIKIMEVRGAPLIGGTAAYGLALAVQENSNSEFIKKKAEELIQSRPTAINLKWA